MKKIIGNSYKGFLIWLCLIISVGIIGCDETSFNVNEDTLQDTQVVEADNNNDDKIEALGTDDCSVDEAKEKVQTTESTVSK